jgi:hypothetical protein
MTWPTRTCAGWIGLATTTLPTGAAGRMLSLRTTSDR